MFLTARQRAAELDADFSTTKKLKGSLHGVPVRYIICLDIHNLLGC